MKSIITNLILLFISTFCFSQSRVFQEVSVAGNRVNIRTEPNLNCKVVYQRNWGDTFQGAKYNDEWYELIDKDENILYAYHKYIRVVEKPNTTDYSNIPAANVVKSDPLILHKSEPYSLYTPSLPVAKTMSKPSRKATAYHTNEADYSNIPESNPLIIHQLEPHALHTSTARKNVTSSQNVTTSQDNKIDYSNIPIENVVKSAPIIIHKSEPYTLDNKPSGSINPTSSSAENPVKKESTAKSVSEPVVKDVITKEETTAKAVSKPIAEQEKSVAKTIDKVIKKPIETKVVEKTAVTQQKVIIAETKVDKMETKSISKPIITQKNKLPKTTITEKVEQPIEAKIAAEPIAKQKTSVPQKTETVEQNAISGTAFEGKSPEAMEVQLLLEQLDAYIELKNMAEARRVALNLINNHVDESVEAENGICILVGEKAYTTFLDILPDGTPQVQELRRLVNDVFDPLVVNLIRLDIVDYWIQEEKYQYALDIMDNIMVHNSESLTLPTHCENDPNVKSSPQIELKNKYFLIYHLLDDDKKKEILSQLKKLKKAKNDITKNIARDIHAKISGDFWEKN